MSTPYTLPREAIGVGFWEAGRGARTIRSFDPCMPCTVHMAAGGRLLQRNATTCMCDAEG